MRPLPAPAQLQHVVWIQTAFLGDLVLTSAALTLLQRHAPHLQQWLVTHPSGAELFRPATAAGLLAGVFGLDKKQGSFWQQFRSLKKQLRSQGLEASNTLILQPHRSSRSSLLSLGLAYPWLTYSESSLAFLATHTVPRVAVLHECSRIALLLEPLGVRREDILACRPNLPRVASLGASPPAELAGLLALTRPCRKLLALAPGSVWGTKRWPIESFTALIHNLATQTELNFVLLGGPSEQGLAATLSQECRALVAAGRLINLVGKTTLAQLCWLFPHLSLVISNDSSPVHFASAYQVPTLALFGATTPALGFGPLAPHSRSLGVEGLGCRPCSDHGPQTCPRQHFRCMRELSVALVARHCRELLLQQDLVRSRERDED